MPTLRLYPDTVIAAGRGFTLSQLTNVLNNTTGYATHTGITPLNGEIGGTLGFNLDSLPADAMISALVFSMVAKASVKNTVAFSSVVMENSDEVLVNKTGLKNLTTSNTTSNISYSAAELNHIPMNALLDPTLSFSFLFISLNGSRSVTTSWQKAYLDVTYTVLTPVAVSDFILTMESI